MCRRWIIRGFFLFLLLLCVVGWALSHVHPMHLNHWGTNADWQVSLAGGRIHVFYAANYGSDDHFARWASAKRGLGFYVQPFHTDFGLEALELDVPLWFPTTVSALFLLFVWRMTRPRKPGGAFPVEVQTSG